MILIEPVCEEQLGGFFLQTLDQAEDIIRELEHPRLKILFDCYHVHRQSGAVSRNFKRCVANIGHVQISAAEARAEPFPGVPDYSVLLPEFQVAGYTGAFGCEYRPQKDTQSGLGWRTPFVESRQPHKTSF